MLILPAVDIKSGKAVRLKQGRADQETIYDDDPVRAAMRWAELGARRIHIVDLDGAFEGAPRNAKVTLAIAHALVGQKRTAWAALTADPTRLPSKNEGYRSNIKLEVGGGLRTFDSVRIFMAANVARCVIGTKALEDRQFLEELAGMYPGRICVGIDAKDGMVVTKGWVKVSEMPATELAQSLRGLRLGEVIYTDIDRDGMLEGPNFKRLEEMRRACPFPLIASGGVTTLDQIRRCKALGCFGAIVGKALYDGRMELKDALAAAE
jgi:phosphoribosylformimino-5-aminoimidazole carboxamide ribotide isomerase